jgi:xylulokinase
MPFIIAYDLGTGGVKASLHGEDGATLGRAFSPYATSYPHPRWHEQRPLDWWQGVCTVTGMLLRECGARAADVRAVALSGHSLVAAPLGRDGGLLMDSVPIWSDTRAANEAQEFFARVPYDAWYMATGNGDPPETYSVMKLMWLQKHYPAVWDSTDKVVGSKDYVNFRLTGNIATDHTYASGSGMFDLKDLKYHSGYIAAAGIDRSVLPDVVSSHTVVGAVTARASAECGLAPGTLVACGGVDNACMALGARGVGEGRAYTSLGSSGWIAVTSRSPILDLKTRPFIFAHNEKGWYTSGVSIFAAGSAYRWLRDALCPDLDGYEEMNALAAASPAGSGGVLFNPTLAGGSTQNVSTALKGAFAGITLSTTRGEMIRAVLEGVAMDLKCYCLDVLKRSVTLEDTMLLCGGGAKSPLWRQIFADVFGMRILKSTVDQDAASLGAAAVAARAAALWTDYGPIDALHQTEQVHTPDPRNRAIYAGIAKEYMAWTEGLSKIPPVTCG